MAQVAKKSVVGSRESVDKKRNTSLPTPHSPLSTGSQPLRMIAWEVTRACNLKCVHCRASAIDTPPPGELSTQEAFEFIDEVVSFSRPVIILTGGEPLLREDIFDIAEYGINKGLRIVMAPNGTLITSRVAKKIKELGIPRISISLDGPSSQIHDAFRGVPGAFEGAVEGIERLKEAGVSFQINTTVTKRNVEDLSSILQTVRKLEADAWHVFLLVPTGRGKEMEADELTPEEYENTLNWLYEKQKEFGLFIKPTCAPHYYRIFKQKMKEEAAVNLVREGKGDFEQVSRGCLGGISFCFVSHMGEVYPCGYLDVLAGNIRESSFKEIWEDSQVFQNLRDFSKLEGKCGLCEYKKICGGCRARAYAKTGDYLSEEPYCVYQPKAKKK